MRSCSDEVPGVTEASVIVARRMATLIDDLLGLSRISRQDLLRRTVGVSAVVGEVAAELRAEHRARPVDVSIAAEMSADAASSLSRR